MSERGARWWSLSTLDISIITIISLVAATAATATRTVTVYRPCWGDIEPAPAASLGDSEEAPLPEGVELRHEPIYYRNEPPQEIGWRSVELVDPSSCHETVIPLGDTSATPRVQVRRDRSNDIYRVSVDDRSVTFRRRLQPGHTLTNLPLRVANLLVLVVALVSSGVEQIARRRQWIRGHVLGPGPLLALGAMLLACCR